MRILKQVALLLLLLQSVLAFSQTGIKVFYVSGTAQTFNVATTGALYFESDNLYIKTDGTMAPTTIPVGIIQKITFAEITTAITAIADKQKISLYPNPSSDFFRIGTSSTENLKVRVYSLTGQLVHQGIYVKEQSIDVSNLITGVYLVQINNSTFKFVKQ